MKDRIVLEPGTPSGCDAIARVYNAVSSRDNPDHVDLDGEYFRAGYRSPDVDMAENVVLARIEEAGVVGYGTAFKSKEQDIPLSRISLKVHPDYTNRGVGTKIFHEVLKIAKKQNAKRAICHIPDFRPSSIDFAKTHGMYSTKYWIKMSNMDLTTIPLGSKPSNLTIREFHPINDGEAWANLQNEIFSGRVGYTPVTSKFLDSFSQSDRFVQDFALFGLVDEEPVVYVMGTSLVSASNNDKRLLIEGIGTKESHRRKGYGKALLFELFRRAITKGYSRSDLVVDNEEEAARQLYSSLGYVERYRRIRYVKDL